MKSLSDVIHRTPWWALIITAFAVLLALAAFVTPYNIIDYNRAASRSVENRAIKREMNRVFADNALDLARNVLLGMRGATSDPQRREELDVALEGLEEARREVQQAGEDVARAQREAAEDVTQAVKEAREAVGRAQRDAQEALKGAGAEAAAVNEALKESLAAAAKAEEEARAAARKARETAHEAIKGAAESARADGKRVIIIRAPGKDKPIIDIELPRPPQAPEPPGGWGPDGPPAGADVPRVQLPALPPELKERIREDVRFDLYRIGVGAGLILILIPLFIITMVAKFFIDRSRAAQRMAELKRKEAEYHRMTQQVTEAKLSALQAQVEPHFLYNTLASVQALTEVDPARANEMTGHLIQYLRNALPKMRESVSTVGQEVELVRAYLNILQMRMGKRLAFDIEVPAALLETPFPPLMLPSLVENAIKHGLEPQREGGHVSIRAEAVDGRLRMIVADTGRGFSDTPGAGVGLANIRERLAAMYGAQAKLTLEANQPRGVVATLEVPRAGARAPAPGAAASPPPQPAAAEAPRSGTRRTLDTMGKVERAWRKGLTFAFVVLVAIAAVLAGLGIVGVTTGITPVQVGTETMSGASGALLGTAGIAVAFAAVVLAIAIVLAVIYGLGFLFVGLAIFIPIVVLVALFPVLAPFVLLGLGIWWLVRRSKRTAAMPAPGPAAAPAAAPRVTPAPPPASPPPTPSEPPAPPGT